MRFWGYRGLRNSFGGYFKEFFCEYSTSPDPASYPVDSLATQSSEGQASSCHLRERSAGNGGFMRISMGSGSTDIVTDFPCKIKDYRRRGYSRSMDEYVHRPGCRYVWDLSFKRHKSFSERKSSIVLGYLCDCCPMGDCVH